MTYLFDIQAQSTIFLFSLGFGFFAGTLYDFLRLFRLLFKNTTATFVLFDLIFMILVSIGTFLFLLVETDGHVRFYILFAELLGFLIYFVTLGSVIAAFFDRIVATLKHSFSKIFEKIKQPFLKLFHRFYRNFSKKAKKVEKKAHFSIKKSKIHLKNLHELLYNQRIRTSVNSNDLKSGESEVDQNGKNKKRKKSSFKKA